MCGKSPLGGLHFWDCGKICRTDIIALFIENRLEFESEIELFVWS